MYSVIEDNKILKQQLCDTENEKKKLEEKIQQLILNAMQHMEENTTLQEKIKMLLEEKKKSERQIIGLHMLQC